MIPLFATQTSPDLLERVAAAQRSVLDSGRFILGPEVQAFESEFAEFCGTTECVGVANGTDAITIALRAAGIEPGDEVIVPSLTFYASAEAVVNAGATPVLCDVDPATFVMTPETVEPLLTPKTRALLPVHLFGNPAPIGALRSLVGTDVRIIEDAAQAAGAKLGGEQAGSLADAATFSFFPSKNLGGFGDGGGITTSDPQIAARARRLRFHGSEDKKVHTEVGYNSRLDDIQAAGLRVLLGELESWTAARRAVSAAYAGSGLGEAVTLPTETADAESCFHLYVIRSPQRDRLAAELAEREIQARAYYTVPMHRQPALEHWWPTAALSGTETAASELLALPMGPALSEEDVRAVASAVNEILTA